MARSIFDLSGRVALVTAGGHGIGRAYCEAMAEFGADVACSDIDMGLATEAIEYIERFGHRAIAINADVSKADQVERMVKETVSQFGTIDILFCNAGICPPLVSLHELDIEDWEKTMAVNLTGTFLTMRAVLPIMMRQKRGSIISTASVAGVTTAATSNNGPYGASKAGIISLTKHAAKAYAGDGIRINAIAPGLHLTKGVLLPSDMWDKIEDLMRPLIPMGRGAAPSEIKGLAVYLASDASSYVTGQTFVQDGGLIA